MRKTSLRCVAVLLLVCILLAGGSMVIPMAKGLSLAIHYIYSLAEYEAELAKYALTGDYVTYDMVKMVGRFDSFRLGITKTLSDDNIWFSLVDESETKIWLDISFENVHTEYQYPKQTATSVSDLHDLRHSQSDFEGSWVYQHEGITYSYHKETLTDISWMHNGRVYFVESFDGGKYARDYPKEAKTFFARLLDVDTARPAVDELMASVDAGQKELKWQEFWRELPFLSAFVAGLIVLIGGGILIWKLRERKRLLDEIEEEEFMAAHKDA